MDNTIYQLQCGSCGEQSFVSASDAVIDWTCSSCGQESITSLPTTTADSGELITDPDLIDSIVVPSDLPDDASIVEGVAN